MADLSTAALLISYQVADFDKWKAVFDSHEADRIAAGVIGHHINRAENDPNALSNYFAVADVEKTKAYAASDALKEFMEEAGLTSTPEILWVTPKAEAVILDRELPGVIITHTVDDFDTWLAGYNGSEAEAMRKSGGIIGHAANQGVDNPSLALVYHQAESFDTLRALAASDELRAVMKDVGVNSEPEFSYHTGGWGKFYQ